MTDLVRWNPFEEIFSWHRDIDELFNRLVDRRLGSTSAAAWGEFFPPVETYTKDGQYIVRLDLPGVNAEEVEVTAEAGILTIKGERKKAHEAKDAEYQYSEVLAGRFERRLPLHPGSGHRKVASTIQPRCSRSVCAAGPSSNGEKNPDPARSSEKH
jgi:HSP20 family protein